MVGTAFLNEHGQPSKTSPKNGYRKVYLEIPRKEWFLRRRPYRRYARTEMSVLENFQSSARCSKSSSFLSHCRLQVAPRAFGRVRLVPSRTWTAGDKSLMSARRLQAFCIRIHLRQDIWMRSCPISVPLWGSLSSLRLRRYTPLRLGAQACVRSI